VAFKIGNPLTGFKEDETYEEVEDAEEAAINASIDDSLWGVWDEETKDWLSLVFMQTLYSN
jgi:hypothetical protein